MAQQGFLLIADITGYTMFLTRSELEHAQGILDALFKSIFAEIKAPILLSNLQGDAALAHLPDVNLPQRQFPLDAIERIYCSFSHALGAMRVGAPRAASWCSRTSRWRSNRWNATCRCRRRLPGPMSPTSRRRSAGSMASIR